MIAFKFLRPGAIGVFSRFPWPVPEAGQSGPWVEAPLVDPCRSGIHACRPQDLPYWLAPELWQMELESEGLHVERRKVVARRGRLVRRIDAWNDETRAAYMDMCASRAYARVEAAPQLSSWAEVIEPSRPEGPSLMGFIAARIAEAELGPEGYAAERAHQARWLIDKLALV